MLPFAYFLLFLMSMSKHEDMDHMVTYEAYEQVFKVVVKGV